MDEGVCIRSESETRNVWVQPSGILATFSLLPSITYYTLYAQLNEQNSKENHKYVFFFESKYMLNILLIFF